MTAVQSLSVSFLVAKARKEINALPSPNESTNSFLQGKERLSDKRINVGNLLDL